MIDLFNYDDRRVRPVYRWPFVYLHGAAEAHNESYRARQGWEATASSDVFTSTVPMPDKPGEYRGMLYCLPVIIVLANKYGDGLNGRVASCYDEAGMQHARNIEAWR